MKALMQQHMNSTSPAAIMVRLNEHSRKPEAAFDACERLMPGARRVELFSRQARPSWDAWGDQAGKFA